MRLNARSGSAECERQGAQLGVRLDPRRRVRYGSHLYGLDRENMAIHAHTSSSGVWLYDRSVLRVSKNVCVRTLHTVSVHISPLPWG